MTTTNTTTAADPGRSIPTNNPIPQTATVAQVDQALRVLGIQPKGAGLISVNFDLMNSTIEVKRNIRVDGRLVTAGVTSIIGIDREGAV